MGHDDTPRSSEMIGRTELRSYAFDMLQQLAAMAARSGDDELCTILMTAVHRGTIMNHSRESPLARNKS